MLHPWISFLAPHIRHLSERQQGWGGFTTPCPLSVQRINVIISMWYPPAAPMPLSGCCWCCPQAGAPCSEQGAELSLHCHAQHRGCAAALQLNSSLAKWWQGIILASPWRVFRLHPEHTSQIFPCSQDNFRDKGLFNSAKLWRLFYTMYNWQIFMWLTSEFKHTLVVQRCD